MSIPRFTRDATAAEVHEALKSHGCAILDGLATEATMRAISAELDPLVSAAPEGMGYFVGRATKRISGLVRKVPSSRALAMDPLILDIMDLVLKPFCERYQLHITQAISVGPDSPAQLAHRDRGMFGHLPWSIEPMVNVMWAVTQFEKANGATRVAPKSNHWSPDRMPEEGELFDAEMGAGSCFLYLGSTIHGAGTNKTRSRRNGIVYGYALGWLRQYENQYLEVPPDFAAGLPRELAGLIGYAAHRPHLGLYETRDPIDFLAQGLPENLAPDDVPDAVSAQLLAQLLADRQAA